MAHAVHRHRLSADRVGMRGSSGRYADRGRAGGRIMKVFVAGASGTIGVPLVRALVASGHQVFAMTRSPEKQQSLRALGATPLVADALDAAALTQALINARPDV